MANIDFRYILRVLPVTLWFEAEWLALDLLGAVEYIRLDKCAIDRNSVDWRWTEVLRYLFNHLLNSYFLVTKVRSC